MSFGIRFWCGIPLWVDFDVGYLYEFVSNFEVGYLYEFVVELWILYIQMFSLKEGHNFNPFFFNEGPILTHFF